jgi:hypothetical protein
MKNHLSDHIKNNSEAMYGETSDMVTDQLKKMVKNLHSKLTYAGKTSRDRFYKDFDDMISVAGYGEHLELEARRKELQQVMLQELASLDAACAKDMTDLAARAKSVGPGSRGSDEKMGDGDDVSDSEGGDSDGNSDSDADDSDDDSY